MRAAEPAARLVAAAIGVAFGCAHAASAAAIAGKWRAWPQYRVSTVAVRGNALGAGYPSRILVRGADVYFAELNAFWVVDRDLRGVRQATPFLDGCHAEPHLSAQASCAGAATTILRAPISRDEAGFRSVRLRHAERFGEIADVAPLQEGFAVAFKRGTVGFIGRDGGPLKNVVAVREAGQLAAAVTVAPATVAVADDLCGITVVRTSGRYRRFAFACDRTPVVRPAIDGGAWAMISARTLVRILPDLHFRTYVLTLDADERVTDVAEDPADQQTYVVTKSARKTFLGRLSGSGRFARKAIPQQFVESIGVDTQHRIWLGVPSLRCYAVLTPISSMGR